MQENPHSLGDFIVRLFYIDHHLISPQEWETEWRIILCRYDFSSHLVSITNQELSEELFLRIDSCFSCIPTIPQHSPSRWSYLVKAYICIIGFWESIECIVTWHSKCYSMLPTIWERIHDGCRHRDWFGWFGCIHHWHSHLDRGLRSVPSEDISCEITESCIERCPHISLDLYLSDDISTIISYLISVSLLDEDIARLLYPPYCEESSYDPNDDGNCEDDEECIHRFIVCVYEIIAKINTRKIPKWMEIFEELFQK